MRFYSVLGATLAVIAGIEGVSCLLARGIQLADGTIYFAQPPDLVAATTTFRNPGVWAKYYFTIRLPDNAGEPLQRVTLTQREGLEDIRFDLEDSYAFEGTRSDKGQRLKLGEVTRDRQTQTVSVTFDPPISPGKTVTLLLRPVHNPLRGGVYLFGVTAFPAGEKSKGQFLGFGRLEFSIPSGL